MMERILTNRISSCEKVNYSVKENDDAFVAEFLVPGFSQKDLNVEVNDNILIVEGKDNQSGWTQDFSQRFRLPDSTDGKNMEAKIENGILKLKLPKKKETNSKKITIL